MIYSTSTRTMLHLTGDSLIAAADGCIDIGPFPTEAIIFLDEQASGKLLSALIDLREANNWTAMVEPDTEE
jgi:hypothetical protein